MMRLSGVLEVDVTPAADEFGYFTGRDAARLVPEIPVGVTVELLLGSCTPLDTLLGPLIEELRSAGSIVVRGSNPKAVASVYRALQIAYARAGAS